VAYREAGSWGVKIVQHDGDPISGRIVVIHQPPHRPCPLVLGPSFGDFNIAPADEGFTEEKEIAHPIATIFIIVTDGVTGLGRQGLAGLSY
jgi:hypothetical protein